MSASKNIVAILKGPGGYALAIIAAAAVLYFFGGKLKDDLLGKKQENNTGGAGIEGGVGGALLGTSDLQRSTNLDGSEQTSYTGRGAVGTAGATVNNALGGLPSTVGSAVGGWLYDLTHLDYTP